jgi:hypothetical protein
MLSNISPAFLNTHSYLPFLLKNDSNSFSDIRNRIARPMCYNIYEPELAIFRHTVFQRGKKDLEEIHFGNAKKLMSNGRGIAFLRC